MLIHHCLCLIDNKQDMLRYNRDTFRFKSFYGQLVGEKRKNICALQNS